MKISIKNKLIGLLAVPVLMLGVVATVPTTAYAVSTCDPVTKVDSVSGQDCNPTASACGDADSIQAGVDCASGGSTATLFGTGSIFNNIVNTLLFVIGALSVVMLIIGGIRYTTSNGAAAQVTAAKNTIMYALVGLVVAFLAFAIVNWVLSGIGG